MRMADVKWIKISTGIFDNRKIRQIENMPDGDALVVIWLKLLILAGEVNDGGLVYFTKDIPFTDQLLSTQFNRPLPTVQLALRTFQQFGMIDIVDDLIMVSNWEKYQSIEGMEKIKEQNRIRKQRQRERERLMLEDGHVTSRDSHATEEDKEKEREEEKKEREDKEKGCYQRIADLYNEICISFPRIRSLSESRKKALKARLRMFSVEDFKTMFEKAEASDFMKGSNDRNWSATFDWMIKDSNMEKILEGNYDNRQSGRRKPEIIDDFDYEAAYEEDKRRGLL